MEKKMETTDNGLYRDYRYIMGYWKRKWKLLFRLRVQGLRVLGFRV